MNFYRIAYEIPRTEERRRCTFIEDDGFTAQQWAGRYCKAIGARLLSLQEVRPAAINNELLLTP